MNPDLTTPEGIVAYLSEYAKSQDSEKTTFASGFRYGLRTAMDAICRKNNIEIPK